MKLVIGGYAQGKLEYVFSKYKLQEPVALDGAWPEPGSLQGKQLVVNHFHQWVKSRISEGGCPEEEISGLGTASLFATKLGMGLSRQAQRNGSTGNG